MLLFLLTYYYKEISNKFPKINSHNKFYKINSANIIRTKQKCYIQVHD